METCPTCQEDFQKLGVHWQYNKSHRPELSDKQQEIVKGLLMGDGCLVRHGNNSFLKVSMVSKRYLELLQDRFGCLGRGVRLERTAKESADAIADLGGSGNAENYSDVFVWNSRSHPAFTEYNSWYAGGSKTWPKGIELTPTVLKHWYCGDGTYDTNSTQDRIKISISNESENTDKVDDMFEQSGLPKPSNYDKRTNGEKDDCKAQFSVTDTIRLFEYMGEPLPDFEYKWPDHVQVA